MLGENMRIGILTEYYESSNYGGNLQAYALTRYINDHYGKTEQIQYKRNIPPQNGGKQLLNKSFQEILIKIFVKSRDLIIGRITKNKIQARIKLRDESIKNFNLSIPHSKVVYSDDTINRSIEDYDCFVVGSDQVWRTFYNRAYFLGFVPENKLKISYAASISRNTLTDNEQAILRETLPGFTGISVREKEAVELVKNATVRQLESVQNGFWIQYFCLVKIIGMKYVMIDKYQNLMCFVTFWVIVQNIAIW